MGAQTDLTDVDVSDGYVQLIHIADDSGFEATEHTICDGDGTAGPISLGTAQVSVLTGKTIDIVDKAGLEVSGSSAWPSTYGTQEASKAVVADANINIGIVKATELHIGVSGSEVQVTATPAELNYLDITTLGTGAASKAVVLDSGDDYTWPATGILTYGGTGITATGAEINYLDIATLGTGAASKAVVLDAGDDYTWPATGILTYGVLNDGTTTLGATVAEINKIADVTGGVITSAATTLSFDAGATIDTSGNNLLTLSGGTAGVRINDFVSINSTISATQSFTLDDSRTAGVGENAIGMFLRHAVTEAASGVHANIATLYVGASVITGGVATNTNLSSLYIAGAPTGGTAVNGPYSIFVDAGDCRYDGGIIYIPDAITATSETVAASVTTTTTEITTNGDTDLDIVSLADGSDGQIKIFAVVAVGNAADSIKITPANMVGGTQITFAASPLGLGCIMEFDSGAGGWIVVANNGGTIA